MKKLSLILLSVIILLTGSCNTWMQDDNFYSDIENDVKVANAKQISVYVRYAMTRQGKTDPDGSATFKVEIPHEISATTEPEYGFVRWAAFPTSYLATGDNQSKNKDIYFIDEDDYNERILPNEIQSPQVVFEDATKPTTSVKINVERNDIYLCPIVAQRPVVSLTIPAKGSSGVVRNMTVRINFSKPMDPESFKNEAGVYDKITVTQGIQSFSADGDIEVSSEDITNRFREPEFSANGKMVTLKFTEEAISEGYASQSSVNITISKDVKDIYGFSMADDDKISFSVGSSMDTLAPRITDLTAGTAINNFHKFKGMYKDADTWNAIQAYTKMEAHLQGSTYLGSANAPTNNIDNAFFDTFAPADTPENASNEGYRVTNKLYIRVFAEDIAGSGSNQNQTGIESDVTMIGIRATPMYNADGSPSTAESVFRASNYMPQANMTGEPGVYKNLIQTVNGQIPGTDNDFAEDKGCLYTFDLSSLPDGLIRVDVAAVDMVQNNGFSDGGALSAEYGNGYATLFVVKDTTAPDASLNADRVQPNTASTTGITADWYYNPTTFANVTVNESSTNHIIDSGHERLRAKHSNLKWTVRLTNDETWKNQLPANPNSSPWSSVANPISFAGQYPARQNLIHFTYALIDDMGNISNVAAVTPPQPVYYDSDAPAFQSIYFEAAEGNTAGVARSNILNTQTLVIPVTEIESGIKKIDIHIDNGTGEYANPFAASFEVLVDGNPTTDFTVSGKTLTFNNRINNFNSNIKITGLKLSDTTQEGNYTISATVTDAAGNKTTSPATVINIDSVAPVVNKIYIPSIYKAIKTHNTSSAEYWMSYNHTIDATGGIPTTDVYIEFTEATSGAKIFDFGSSSIHLTDASTICTVDSTTLASITGIAATVNTTLNTLTINSSVEAGNLLKGSSSVMVKITNVQLASSDTGAPADSTVNIKIHDTATNTSAAQTNISRQPGASSDTITSFKYDPYAPVTAQPTLTDRASESGHIAAQAGYTSEVYINSTVAITPTISGIYAITIDGNSAAVFDSTTTMTSSTDSTPLNFTISDSGKTATFYRLDPAATSPTPPQLPAVISSSTAVTINISNLLLTSGDGSKSVAMRARSFNDVTGANSTANSITLDTVPPAWVSDAFYTQYDTAAKATKVYPHPIPLSNGKVYGLTDIESGKIIFYHGYEAITVSPDTSETNKLTSQYIAYTNTATGSTTYSTDLYQANGNEGIFTAVARDCAGNQSVPKTIKIVNDRTLVSTDEKNDIKNYFTLSKPATANVWRNSPSTSGSVTTAEYIIRGSNNTSVSDTEFKIIVKLGSGVTTTDTDKRIDGTDHPVTKGEYSRRTAQIDSAPIEYYGIALGTDSFSETNYKKYEHSSTDHVTSYGDITIHSNVDEYGNIEIKIPNKTCTYFRLYLKDGCGNDTYILVSDPSNNCITWNIDKGIGSYDGIRWNYSGEKDFNYTSNSSLLKNFSDVTFYNSTLTLSINNCSDSVRFGSHHEASSDTEVLNNGYTMRARIITWNGSGNPTQDDFYESNFTSETAASPWKGWKEGLWEQIPSLQRDTLSEGTSFSLSNIEFPKPNTTTPYQLWYILEDTVGNCRIEQIKPSSSVSKWLYDNTAPVVDSYQFYKINQVTDGSTTKNYYSDNSYVTYNISDAGSGIAYDGVNSLAYSSFNSRNPSIPSKTYSLFEKITSSNQLLLAGIVDYAGNTTSPASIPLSKDGITTWVRQSTAPALYSTTNTKKATAIQNSTFGGVSPTVESDSATSGQVLHIKAKSATLSVIAKFGVTDTTKLLGWKVTNSPITTSSTDFYEAGGLTQLTYDSTNNVYSITYNKTNTLDYFTQWKDDTSGATKYYYPVNRAGLIGNPIKVEFVENLIPYITDAGLTYNTYGVVDTAADEPSTPPTITKEGEGADAIYYIKSGAKLRFTTVNAPTTARIHYGTGSGDYVSYTLASYSVSGMTNTYAIPLDTSTLTSHLTSTSGTSLKLTLHTEDEDSPEIPLNGPAAGSASNKWVYDTAKPTISAGDFISVGYDGPDTGSDDDEAATVSGDTTKYIQSDTTKITLTYSDGTSGTEIAHYQWKVGSEAWADIGTPLTQSTGVVEFSAPAAKTAYKFRVIDHAGNISTVADAGTIQKDKWGPDGNLTYTADTDFDFENLDKGELVGTERNEKIRIINYSNSSSNDRAHLNTITVNFANITDKRNSSDEVSTGTDGIERSGIDHFEIEKNDPTPLFSGDDADKGTRTFDADTTTATIDLSYSDGVSQYTYIIRAVDKLGQSTVLKTLKVRQDSQAPQLVINTIHADEAKTIEAISSSDSSVTTKFLKGDKAVITFTIDDPDATYYYRAGTTGSWTPIAVSSETLTATSLKFTLDAPTATTTYNFYAKDAIGNESTVRAVTLVQDITAPQGAAGTPQLENASGAITEGFVKTESATDSTDITYLYNSNTISKLTINVASIAEAVDASNSGFSGYFLNDSDTALTGTSSPVSISGNTLSISLADTMSDTSYAIKVKDYAGNQRTLYTFHFTADGDAPNFTLSSVQTKGTGSTYDVTAIGTGDDSVYYICRANAILTFATTTPTDIDHYEWDNGTGTYITTTPITLTDMVYTFAAPEPAETTNAPTTYKFRAVDKVGNATEITPIKLVHDETGPTGTITGISLNDQDGNAFTDTSYYIATTPADSTTTTILFNSNQVKSITFTDSGSDNNGGSGYDNTALWYKVGDGNTTAMTDKTLPLGTDLNGVTYHIYAKDKVGNKTEIGTYVFTADGEAKIADTDKKTIDGRVIERINNYTTADGTAIPSAKWKMINSNQKVNYFASGTQIKYAKSGLPADFVQYQFVQTTTTGQGNSAATDGYTSTAGDSWETLSDGTADNSGDAYIITLPTINEYYTRLSLFFKDKVGNVCGPYFLGNSTDAGINWWMTNPTLTSSNITITTDHTWDSAATSARYFNISVTLPEGTVVESVTSEDSNITINNIQFPFSNQDLNTTKVVYQPNGTNPGLTMQLVVQPAITDSSAIKIKINGVEQGVFVAVSGSFFGGSGSTSGITGITGTGRKAQDSDRDSRASGDSRDSRVTQFFNNLSNAFISKPEVSTDTSVSEKPVTTAKKTAKKASKKAKQTAKATQKASPVTAPAAAAETAEIITPNVVSEVIETSVTAPEAKVNVAESSVVEAQVSASSTVEPASEPAEKRVPSKSASIVIMLSIICSIGVVLYLNKSRKK